MNLISSCIGLAKNFFGWLAGRQTLTNSPEMQANAGAARDSQEVGKLNADEAQALKTGDVTHIQKDAAP